MNFGEVGFYNFLAEEGGSGEDFYVSLVMKML